MTTINLALYLTQLGLFICLLNNNPGSNGQVVIQPVFVTSTQEVSTAPVDTSRSADTSSADTSGQVVRIVVNTVVSSGDGSKNPVVNQQSAINSDHTAVLSFPGGDHIRPSSSRPEKRKADGSLFFPDGNIMDHGTVDTSVSHEESYTGHTEEANVQIADYAKPSATLPTGLVTTMGGTVVLGGQTTVHETKVIGTYIDGTYAQILQSTSKIFENERNVVTATVLADSSSSTTSTVSSVSSTSSTVTATKITISPTPTSTGKWPHLKSRPLYTGISRKMSRSSDSDKPRQSRELTPSIKPSRSRQSKNLYSSLAAQRARQRKSSSVLSPTMSTVSVTSPTFTEKEPQTITPSTVVSTKSVKSSARKSRTRSTIRAKSSTRNHNAYKNAVTSRFTYTPNPNKYYPRRRRVKSSTNTNNTDNGSGESMEARTIEMTSSRSMPVIVSTVTSTITTELTQFYGSDGSSNSLVFMTTYEQPMVVTVGSSETNQKSSTNVASAPENNIFNPFLEDPLDEEMILDVTQPTSKSNTTISLSTITDDVTTTETLLQTSFLPITIDSSTSVLTLLQTFYVTKIVHALRTVPPPELMASVVSVDLNAAESEHKEDFLIPNLNSSDIFSLLNLTDNDVTQPTNGPTNEIVTEKPLDKSPFALTPPPAQYQQNGNPFFNPFINPFAYLGYGMVPPMVPPGIVTTSSAVYSTETIYGTKVLPIWDGLSTSFHTTKAPSTTKVHTNYETYVTTQMGLPVPQQPVLPNFAPAQTITTPTTFVTTDVETSTQVLKLMYDGYKTSYRTLLSTTAVVKTVTSQVTTTVPFGQYPGFFG